MLEELRISFETGLEPAGAALGGFGGALYDNRDPLCSTFSFLHFFLVCALCALSETYQETCTGVELSLKEF